MFIVLVLAVAAQTAVVDPAGGDDDPAVARTDVVASHAQAIDPTRTVATVTTLPPPPRTPPSVAWAGVVAGGAWATTVVASVGTGYAMITHAPSGSPPSPLWVLAAPVVQVALAGGATLVTSDVKADGDDVLDAAAVGVGSGAGFAAGAIAGGFVGSAIGDAAYGGFASLSGAAVGILVGSGVGAIGGAMVGAALRSSNTE